MPLRWCVCEGLQTTDCPLRIDVLMHRGEVWRPTSTGHLINRVIPASGHHVFKRIPPLERGAIARPDRTLWVLHPSGRPPPANVAPESIQILLLDGTWRQAADMLRAVEGWGTKVCLPMTGPGRYWLRTQQEGSRYSTVEALLFLLESLGLRAAHEKLRLQFELHVYAGLCVRGKMAEAGRFLESSPLQGALPGLLSRLPRRLPVDDPASPSYRQIPPG